MSSVRSTIGQFDELLPRVDVAVTTLVFESAPFRWRWWLLAPMVAIGCKAIVFHLLAMRCHFYLTRRRSVSIAQQPISYADCGGDTGRHGRGGSHSPGLRFHLLELLIARVGPRITEPVSRRVTSTSTRTAPPVQQCGSVMGAIGEQPTRR